MKTTQTILKVLLFTAICIGFAGSVFAAAKNCCSVSHGNGYHTGYTAAHISSQPVIVSGVTLSFGTYGQGICFTTAEPVRTHRYTRKTVRTASKEFRSNKSRSHNHARRNSNYGDRCSNCSGKNNQNARSNQDGRNRIRYTY